MGTTYSIEYVKKDRSNSDYTCTYDWDRLPSVYQTTQYWTEGKGSFPISLAFHELFDNTISDPDKLLSYFRIKLEYKEYILNKLNSISGNEYKKAYHNKEYYLKLVDKLFKDIEANPQLDFYFIWG